MGRAAELGPAPAEPGEVAGEQKADFKSVLGNKTPSSAREAQTVLGERPGGAGKQSRFSGAAGNFRCPTLGTENGLVKHAGTCPGEIRSRGKSPEVGEARALFPPQGEEKAGHPAPLENLGQTQVKREFCAWGARRSGGTRLKALSQKQTNAQSMF